MLEFAIAVFRGVFKPWQMATLLVKCYPAVPDALGIASALASELGEPEMPMTRQLTLQLGGYLGESQSTRTIFTLNTPVMLFCFYYLKHGHILVSVFLVEGQGGSNAALAGAEAPPMPNSSMSSLAGFNMAARPDGMSAGNLGNSGIAGMHPVLNLGANAGGSMSTGSGSGIAS